MNKRLTSDDFIAASLQRGLYDVDLNTGIVTNKTGRKLAAPPDKDGYRTITIVLGKGLQRTVRVHRVAACKAWGVEAIRGRPVGHRDGDRTNNCIDNLWIPASVKEHNEVDGTVKNLLAGQRKRKECWGPCVRCGEADGPPAYGRKSPARVSGARFGIDGDLCWRCYHTLHERERRAQKRSRP